MLVAMRVLHAPIGERGYLNVNPDGVPDDLAIAGEIR